MMCCTTYSKLAGLGATPCIGIDLRFWKMDSLTLVFLFVQTSYDPQFMSFGIFSKNCPDCVADTVDLIVMKLDWKIIMWLLLV